MDLPLEENRSRKVSFTDPFNTTKEEKNTKQLEDRLEASLEKKIEAKIGQTLDEKLRGKLETELLKLIGVSLSNLNSNIGSMILQDNNGQNNLSRAASPPHMRLTSLQNTPRRVRLGENNLDQRRKFMSVEPHSVIGSNNNLDKNIDNEEAYYHDDEMRTGSPDQNMSYDGFERRGYYKGNNGYYVPGGYNQKSSFNSPDNSFSYYPNGRARQHESFSHMPVRPLYTIDCRKISLKW